MSETKIATSLLLTTRHIAPELGKSSTYVRLWCRHGGGNSYRSTLRDFKATKLKSLPCLHILTAKRINILKCDTIVYFWDFATKNRVRRKHLTLFTLKPVTRRGLLNLGKRILKTAE